jgi:hypothetical protein
MRRAVWTLVAAALLPAGGALAKQPERDLGDTKDQAMRECPSATPGAVTTVDNRQDGVQLTVVGANDEVATEIQRRAHQHENLDASARTSGSSAGNALYAFCPGMQEGTLVSVEDLPDGAMLTVHARAPGDVPVLQQTTRARIRNLRASR